MDREFSPAVQDDAMLASGLEAGAPDWFALRVLPRHEKTVHSLLGNKGFETLLPMYTRRHQYPTRVRSFELPLFPGYLFCRFDPLARLPILTTPGVLHVVGAGRAPVPVNQEEIAAIQRALQAGVMLSPVSQWQAGQRGRITSGPLAGLEGVILRVKPTIRLVLSVTLLERCVVVEIESGCVSLI